jgi:WD40 repeat protein
MDTPAQPPNDPAPTRLLPTNPGSPTSPPASTDQVNLFRGASHERDLSFLAPSPLPDRLGRVGAYDVVRVVGQGAMGIVLEAVDPSLNRRVAVKVMAAEWATSDVARQRFLREARTAAAVRHPGVVAIHAVDEHNGLPYLVMQLVSGHSLEERLEQAGRLSVPEVVRLGAEVAEGLAAAHAQGLVHRDVKPANILVESSSGQARLTDFGLARAADDTSLTRTGAIAGTPLYMAPEQARGERIDHRADLFSLGSVLYALCTGQPPFQADTTLAILRRVCLYDPAPIQAANPIVPAWLEAIVGRLHEKRPEDRIGSATELARLLRQGQVHLRDPARHPAPPVVQAVRRRPTVRRRALWLLAAVVLLAGLAVGGWALWRPRPQPRPGPGIVEVDGKAEPPVPPVPADPVEQSWKPLFNGEDLGGWRRFPGQPGVWQAHNGEIVAAGPTSHLYTVRDNFADFHLRLEALVEPGDESSLYVRSGLGPSPVGRGWFPEGYAVRLAAPPRPSKWQRVEVIATGPRLLARINGKTVLDFEDRAQQFRRGHIALQKLGRGTKVRFRKIEIREQGTKPPPAPLPAPSPPRVLLQALADTPTVAAGGVKYDQDGWRIDPAKKAPRPVPLFEIDRPDFETGRVTCRFQVRGQAAGAVTVSLVLRYPDRGEVVVGRLPRPVTTTWGSHETAFFNFVPGQKPERMRIEVIPPAKGPVWLREVRVEQQDVRPDRQAVEVMRPRPTDLAVEALTTLTGHVGPVTALAFSADGRTLVTAGEDAQVIFWSLGDGRWQKRRARAAGGGPVAAVAFAPDDSTLAAACHDGKVRLWRRQGEDWTELAPLGGHSGPVGCLAWSPDGSRLATGEAETTPPEGARVRVWDVRQGKELFRLGEGKIGGVGGVLFTPDGKRLGIGWGRRSGAGIEWWDLDSRKVVDSHASGPPLAWDHRFLPGGGQIGANVYGPHVGIWRQQGKEWHGGWHSQHTAPVRALAFSPDAALLASGSQDQTVLIRDVASGLELATLRGHQAEVFRVAFSRDGSTLATAGLDATVKLWRLAQPAAPGPFVVLGRPERGHASLAAAVAAAADGDVIEVRGNGPFVTGPVVIHDKALTIRAGAGYWPLIAVDLRRTARPPWSAILSNASLTLEGLELHRTLVANRTGGALVGSIRAPLRLAHCRLFTVGDAETIVCDESTGCELKDCILLPENGASVVWNRPRKCRLVVDGCLVGGRGLVVRDMAEAMSVSDVRLLVKRSTVVGERALEFRVDYPTGKVAEGPVSPGLEVEVERSVLDAKDNLVGFRLMKDPNVSAAAALARLRDRLGWRDRGCLLRLEGAPLALGPPAKEPGPLLPVTTLGDWDRVWGQIGTGSSAGQPTYAGGKNAAPGSLHQALVPGDVRLMGSTVGADADQLGPGPAYWRWRQSPDYQRWQKPPTKP